MTYIDDDLPHIDRLSKRRLEFLRATVAKNASNADLGMFLELCAKYDLDPFAGEIWLATPENGRVLLMVGRAGLRKIAMRQGMVIDGDVVRERDRFEVVRNADRSRTITHAYAEVTEKPAAGAVAPTSRGRIVGAWAEVYDAQGEQRGFFFALMSEYRPTSEGKLKHTPWGAQESTMIRAAAERQALAQATPLGGIVAEGELDRVQERRQLGAGTGSGVADGVPLPPSVLEVMRRAALAGHAGLADRASVELQVAEQPEEFVLVWVREALAELDAFGAGGGDGA